MAGGDPDTALMILGLCGEEQAGSAPPQRVWLDDRLADEPSEPQAWRVWYIERMCETLRADTLAIAQLTRLEGHIRVLLQEVQRWREETDALHGAVRAVTSPTPPYGW